MKLVDQSRATWQNRALFVGIAARLMRRIPVIRDWNRASVWLKHEVSQGKCGHAG